MAITDPLLLSPDLILVPVAELPEEVRGRFEHEEGDVAVTHPRSRTPSRILDARSAELLEEFRTPRTIVEAVIRFSRAREADPEATLEEAYPLLQRLLNSGFLVPEDSAEAEGIRPSLAPGEEFAGFEVVECVQGLEDTELYQVRGQDGIAALKIERQAAAGRRAELFAREEAILAHLGGEGSPRLLAAGDLEGRRWIVLEWCAGVDAATAAAELRRFGEAGRPGLLALCREIAAAYARLHERGVVHGDVHPRNILVGRDGEVRLLDFGYSRWDAAPAELARPGRAGVAFFYEPEYAAAVRAGLPHPAASPVGEQHAVAALLYLLLTGAHYLDFSLERQEMQRQIAEELPRTFAERGVEPWPEVEATLARALCKAPEQRFPSVAGLAAALAKAEVPPSSPTRVAGSREAEVLLTRFLERAGEGGALFASRPTPPTASITYGAAGIACALYRIALAREDVQILALADLWGERAAAACGSGEGFYNPELGIGPDTVGENSVYHTAAGVHAVRALIGHALGLSALQAGAVRAFLDEARRPCPYIDLSFGRSGFLLAGSLLVDTLGPGSGGPRGELAAWGEAVLRDLWRELDELPPISEPRRAGLGMAHGWAGYLYAALRWCRSAGTPLPDRLGERLGALADLARPWGRGLRWRWSGAPDGSATMPGWCNGSAGFVFLGTLATRMLGEPRYRELAEGAAWNAWEAPDGNWSLCCGLAGRAWSLLHFGRHGGGREWLDRARLLADRAAREASRAIESPDSLYKGKVGIAALAADLAGPEGAAMPFFEEEGWPG